MSAERQHCEAAAGSISSMYDDRAMEAVASLIERERAGLLARIALLESALQGVVDATVGIDGRVAVAVHRAEAVLRGST